MSVAVVITRPDGSTKTIRYRSVMEAARYGVAYYLRDNDVTDSDTAWAAGVTFRKSGTTEVAGYTFNMSKDQP